MQQKLLLIILLAFGLLTGCNKKEAISEAQFQLLKALVDKTISHQTSENKEPANADSLANGLNPVQPTKTKAKPTVNAPVGKLFTMNKADTLQLLGAKLCVPAGSLERNRTLSITALQAHELPQLPSGMVNVTDGAAGFRFLPHGEHFRKAAATIIIPFDTTLIPQGYTTKDIRTYYFNEARRQWTALAIDTISAHDAMVCALTTHFTDMINGIIQVPESPETQGYAPTSITDIKAANPATGIMAMAPPSASQSGAATMSYPFNLPAGRKGMQPSLALQYSSEAQSGWVGYGWSLSIPSIDIETRWGVPLFDANSETESYLVMGEQLTDQAHRAPDVARASNKQFYPRIEGGFSKIIRQGDSPKNYWWELTDKSGTKHFFGGRNNALDEASIVRNTDGNIVHWALTETRNVYDDFVHYSYVQTGGMLYPAQITYTGQGTTPGLHRVEMVRFTDDEITRRDITSNGRLGFLQVNNQQLNEVRIYFRDELLRSYQLNYDEGVFAKNMLAAITQKDADGNNFNTHNFDYYNDVENGLYGKSEKWNAGDDASLKSLFESSLFNSDMSAINGGYSSGSTSGGGVMIGIGWGSAKYSVSAGVSLVYSKNKNTGMVTLMDINGDGLPDKVFIDGSSLCYRPNISNKGIKGEEFGEKKKITGMNRFSYSESSSSSRNINASVGVNITKSKKSNIGAGISRDKAKSTDKIKIYFSDFNGDGLPDIANNGTVYFNYIDDNGHPKFEATSALTPNPIAGTNVSFIDTDFTPDYKAERISKEAEFPLHDVVRVWRAPYEGELRMSGNIELTVTALGWHAYEGSPDGIIASIQQEENLLWKDSITSFGDILKPELGTLNVKAGDRLLFRLQSRYSGALDEVKWNPSIKYDSIYGEIDTLDENNLDRYQYSAEKDFVFCGQPSVILAKPGTVQVSMPIDKKQLRDDITLVVEQYNTLSDATAEIFRETLLGNDIINNNVALQPINVIENDTIELIFYIESHTPVDWTGITWKPVVEYLTGNERFYLAPDIPKMFNKPVAWAPKHRIITQSIVDLDTDIDNETKEEPEEPEENPITFIPDPKYYIESDTTKILYLSPIKAIPFLNIKEYAYPDSMFTIANLSLRDSMSIFKTYSKNINGFQLVADTLEINSDYEGRNVLATYFVSLELNEIEDAGVRLFREKVFEISDIYMDPNDSSKTISVGRTDTILMECDTIPASVYSVFNRTDIGHLYRGWGQFGWDGNLKGIIPPDKLIYDDKTYEGINKNTVKDTSYVNNIVANESLFAMSFNAEKGCYQSISEYTYVSPSTQSSARLGSLEIVIDSINFPTGGAALAALVQQTESTTYTTSATGSFAGGSGGYSKSTITS